MLLSVIELYAQIMWETKAAISTNYLTELTEYKQLAITKQFKEGEDLAYGLVGIKAIKQRTLQKVKLKLKKGYVRILLGDTKEILHILFFWSQDSEGFFKQGTDFLREHLPHNFFESFVLKIDVHGILMKC